MGREPTRVRDLDRVGRHPLPLAGVGLREPRIEVGRIEPEPRGDDRRRLGRAPERAGDRTVPAFAQGGELVRDGRRLRPTDGVERRVEAALPAPDGVPLAAAVAEHEEAAADHRHPFGG
jgi:hypothetical protein